MKEILFITCNPNSKGGISTWVKSLQKINSEKGLFKDYYIYPAYNGKKEKNNVHRSFIGRVFIGGYLAIKNYMKLKKIINSHKFSIAHITTSGSLGLIRDLFYVKLIKRKRIPIIYHLHFGRMKDIIDRKKVEKHLFFRIFRIVDSVVTIDNKTYETLRMNTNIKRIYKLPNFVDVRDYNYYSNVRREVIFIGWCIKSKGIEELLEAWDLFSKKDIWNLRLVGPYNNSYLESLKNKYLMTNVVFEGEKEHNEAMNLLSKASVLVLPSYSEGFPYVILEGMALKKTIIASNVGAISEMLSPNCGVLIEPHNAMSILKALEMVADNDESLSLYGKSSYEKLITSYDASIVIQKMVDIWDEFCDE